MNLEAAVFAIGALLLLSVLATRAGGLLGIPSLLIFLFIGMLTGSDGPGKFHFDNPALTQNLSIVALAFILFAGGMDTSWKMVRPSIGPSLSLATIGVLISTLVVGALGSRMLGIQPIQGFLLGAIVSSTDAAAVFSILRGSKLKVPDRLHSILELESGLNDPIAVFLTATLVAVIQGEHMSVGHFILDFLKEMIVGILFGVFVGWLGVILMKKLKLEMAALYQVVGISLVLISFGGAQMMQASGIISVYVAGLAFGNGEYRQAKGLQKFHDGLAWLMQIMMFLVLGLQVFPHQLPTVALAGVGLTVILLFVARPIAVAISLSPFRIPWREQVFVAWTGLRGAVPIVLATFPLLAELEGARVYFNIVFFVVGLSVLIQSYTLGWIGGKLFPEPPPPSPLPTA